MRKSSEDNDEGGGQGNICPFSWSELSCLSLGHGVRRGRNFHFLPAVMESVVTRAGKGYDLTGVFKRLPASSGEW